MQLQSVRRVALGALLTGVLLAACSQHAGKGPGPAGSSSGGAGSIGGSGGGRGSASASPAAALGTPHIVAAVTGDQAAQASVDRLRRDGAGHVTLVFTVVNVGQVPVARDDLLSVLLPTYDASGVSLVDYAHRLRYYPLADADGHCLCSQTDNTPIPAHGAEQFYAQYPAPPAGVDTVDVNIPRLGNLNGVHIDAADSAPLPNPSSTPSDSSTPPDVPTDSPTAAPSYSLARPLAVLRPESAPTTVAVEVLSVYRTPGATLLVLGVRNSGTQPYVTSDFIRDRLTGSGFGEFSLLDPAGGKLYREDSDPLLRCLCQENLPAEIAPGGVVVNTMSFPPLAPGVSSVQVSRTHFSTSGPVPVAASPPADPSGLPAAHVPAAAPAVILPVGPAPRMGNGIQPLVRLIEDVQGRETTVAKGPNTQITLASDVLFAFGKADLTSAAQALIADVAQQIDGQRTAGTVTVTGYTDSVGSDSVNVPLSQQRAANVAAALQGKVHATGLKFDVQGKGSADPVAPNMNPGGGDNPAGRAKNRRVTIGFGQG